MVGMTKGTVPFGMTKGTGRFVIGRQIVGRFG